MLSISFPGQERIELVDTAMPEPGPGELLLRVVRTALCGSDTKLWRKGSPYTPGHEIFGVVEAAGHPLHHRRCLVFMPVFCGHCACCLRGDTHVCLTESVLIGWNRPGGYAQWLAVPEQCLMPVPDDIDDDLAPLLLDTIGTSGHGLRTVAPLLPPPAATDVLVLGAGPIGLGALLGLQQLGFRRIWISDMREGRLAIARSLGACVHPVGALDRRFHLVVESSGAHAARNQGLTVVWPRGVVLLLGENDAPWTIEETRPIRRKDFFMVRSFYFPKSDFSDNLAWLRQRGQDYRGLVDRTITLPQFADAFARFAAGDMVKPLLAP